MQRVAHRTIAAALITLTLSACRDYVGPPIAGPRPSREETPALSDANIEPTIIAASTTDANIDFEVTKGLLNAEHYVWIDPSARGNPKLLVFLPGATFRPAEYQLVQREAARLGYYVIGLMYQNDKGVEALCKTRSAPEDLPNCSGDMRSEILTGRAPEAEEISPLVDVTQANGIDNRLTKLLDWLSNDENHAGQGWSRFLEMGGDGTLKPKWSQIAVAGHSQGAGEAAFIAKLRHIDRVVMFAGPPERSDAHLADHDPWVSIGETPASKYFALYHKREPLALDVAGFGSNLTANLTALNMFEFGGAVRVEENRPPYDGTHILYTDLPPTGGYEAKRNLRSTSMDAFTPMQCSTEDPPVCTPALIDAWRYLLR